MTPLEVARSLEHSSFAVAIRDSMWGFAILITVHVLALGMFLGTVMLVDLRLLRAEGHRRRRLSRIWSKESCRGRAGLSRSWL